MNKKIVKSDVDDKNPKKVRKSVKKVCFRVCG